MEGLTKKTATGFLPVALNYKQALLEQGIPEEKIRVVPCTVPLDTFRFSSEARAKIRTRLNLAPDTLVGIYAGKFGGIYYETEAFEIFRKGFEIWSERFFLIILTSNSQEYVQDHVTRAGIDSARVFTILAPHAEVPNYLSAADLAYNLVKPGPSKRFTSSIKNGEYWASGLPMLIPPDMGDDSDIITREGIGGAIFDLGRPGSLEEAYRSIDHYLRTHSRESPEIAGLAQKYRTPEFIRQGYDHFLLPYGRH
jgi:glycosyltransferase involved in cell wall biosynthesis